jgi:hypothetical protein
MLHQLDPNQMAAGLSATQAAGLDPAAVMQRILQSPVLADRLRNPRVMQAVLEMTRWGGGVQQVWQQQQQQHAALQR